MMNIKQIIKNKNKTKKKIISILLHNINLLINKTSSRKKHFNINILLINQLKRITPPPPNQSFKMEFFRMIGGAIDVEQMPFQLVKKEDTFEIRDYEPCVVAETIDQGNNGFRTLARYIGVFGTPENRIHAGSGKENKNGAKIAMTAPVINQKIAMTAPVINQKINMTAPVLNNSSSNGMMMAFVLPKEYKTIESAPVPTNKNVKLREIPKRKCAVIQFTWNINEKQGEEKATQFISTLKSKGYHTGTWQLARYNPPFTIPFLRTNEIIVELQNDDDTMSNSNL